MFERALVQRVLVLLLLLPAYGLPASAAEVTASRTTGVAVFGSWRSRDSAEREARTIAEALSIETSILIAELEQGTFHRVTSGVLAEPSARALVVRAKAQGYGAWFLRAAAAAAATGPSAHGARPAPQVSAEPAAAPAPAPAPRALSDAPPVAAPTPEPQREAADAPTPQEEFLLSMQAQPSGDAVRVPFVEAPGIDIDGRVDELVWQEVPGYDNMTVSEPDTGEKPPYATFTRFVYTKRGLYVAAVMEQPRDTLINRLSARDQYLNRDSFHITLDTSGTGLYGYWFEVSLGDTLLDGKVVPERSFSEQWDGPWLGASAVTDNGWSAELFLPWSMMTMPSAEGDRKLGFWVRRKVAHRDEAYGWPNLPFNQPRFMSALQEMRVPGIQPRQNLSLFPYASATVDEIADEDDAEAGLDFFYSPSSNLQLTGTVNPDFGAVESDDVVVNLTAFETYFPEKRLFFLEGNEVFVTSWRSDPNRFNARPEGTGARATPSTFQSEPTTLMNTRRIGGAARHVDIPAGIEVSDVERTRPTDLLGAVKVVGQTGALRYGFLSAFEDDVELRGRDTATGQEVTVEGPGRDFGVVRALYETSDYGRKAIGYIGTMVTLPGDDAMTHGIDAHYLSPDGRIRADAQYMYSNVESATGESVEGHGVFADVTYAPSRTWLHRFSFDYLDDELDISDFGFIRRNDTIAVQYGLVRTQTRGLKSLRRMRNSLFLYTQWSRFDHPDDDPIATRVGLFSNQTFALNDRSEVKFFLNYFPRQWDDRNSRGNGVYETDGTWFTQIAYGTDTAKPFAFSGTLTAEQEKLGDWTYGTDLGITWKPSGRFSLDFDIRYKERDGWLVHRGGRNFTTYAANDLQPLLAADFFFNARHQLRMTLQWAGIRAEDQAYWEVPLVEGPLIPRAAPPAPGSEDFTISRLTAQLRYRWEIGPLSDLFVVYTRGSNLPTQPVDIDFDDLFTDAFDQPIVDVFIVKLRYRFGV